MTRKPTPAEVLEARQWFIQFTAYIDGCGLDSYQAEELFDALVSQNAFKDSFYITSATKKLLKQLSEGSGYPQEDAEVKAATTAHFPPVIGRVVHMDEAAPDTVYTVKDEERKDD